MPHTPIHLVPGDTLRLAVDEHALRGQPAIVLGDGTEVWMSGFSRLDAHYRSDDDLLREALTRMLATRVRPTKTALRALLASTVHAPHEVEID